MITLTGGCHCRNIKIEYEDRFDGFVALLQHCNSLYKLPSAKAPQCLPFEGKGTCDFTFILLAERVRVWNYCLQ